MFPPKAIFVPYLFYATTFCLNVLSKFFTHIIINLQFIRHLKHSTEKFEAYRALVFSDLHYLS